MNYISQQEPNQMWIKKVLMLVLADILIVLISYFMALLLRFDFVFSSIPEEYLMGYLWSMPFLDHQHDRHILYLQAIS